MKRFLLLLCMIASIAVASYAQSYVETFDANSLGWTESAGESFTGSAVIDKGVLTIKSKSKNDLSMALRQLSSLGVRKAEDTFFETHCYAPIDVKKPFEVIANINIGRLAIDGTCGFIFNYKDGGNFYCFNFNDEMVRFTRYANNEVVGNIMQGVKWQKKSNIDQQWKLVSDGDILSFFVDGMEILKVKYMPLDFSGIGFYAIGRQTLVVEDITFTQF